MKMSKLIYFLKQSWLLIAAAFFFGMLLAGTNNYLQPKIQQNKKEKINKKLSTLINAQDFEKVDTITVKTGKNKKLKSNIYKALKNNSVIGWGFTTEGSGFADKIELIVALDSNIDSIKGYAILSSNETPGFGTKIENAYFKNQFKGAPAKKLDLKKTGESSKIDSEIIAISGATVSSSAVVDIINMSLLPIKEKMKEKGLIKK